MSPEMQRAVEAALKSTHPRYRVGAALFCGNKILSTGFNSLKTHPKSKTRFNQIHAELHCLIRSPREYLNSATLYVARIKRDLSLGCSKPCEYCWLLIEASDIKEVVYVNEEGAIEEWRR